MRRIVRVATFDTSLLHATTVVDRIPVFSKITPVKDGLEASAGGPNNPVVPVISRYKPPIFPNRCVQSGNALQFPGSLPSTPGRGAGDKPLDGASHRREQPGITGHSPLPPGTPFGRPCGREQHDGSPHLRWGYSHFLSRLTEGSGIFVASIGILSPGFQDLSKRSLGQSFSRHPVIPIPLTIYS